VAGARLSEKIFVYGETKEANLSAYIMCSGELGFVPDGMAEINK
jgi:hypothetical protein